MTTFYLFRHGETQFSVNDTPYGDQILTAPLLPEGLPIIKKMGEYLKNIQIDASYVSYVFRCQETAKIIENITGRHFITDQRLGEWLLPEEEFDALKLRLKEFVEEIKSKNYQSVAICTHGACVAGIAHLLIKGDFLDTEFHDYPKTGVIWKIEGLSKEPISFS